MQKFLSEISTGSQPCRLPQLCAEQSNEHIGQVRQLMEETASEEAAASTWEEKYLQGVILGIAAALVLILVIAIGAQIYQSIAGSSGGNGHAKQ